MRKSMFQNPKSALIFVGITMLSVAMLVGPEGNEGALVRVANDIEEQGHSADTGAPPVAANSAPEGFAPADPEAEAEFWDDEELIDDTLGFDPTPEVEMPFEAQPFQEPAYEAEPVLVESTSSVEQF